jgi:hypothetical protein
VRQAGAEQERVCGRERQGPVKMQGVCLPWSTCTASDHSYSAFLSKWNLRGKCASPCPGNSQTNSTHCRIGLAGYSEPTRDWAAGWRRRNGVQVGGGWRQLGQTSGVNRTGQQCGWGWGQVQVQWVGQGCAWSGKEWSPAGVWVRVRVRVQVQDVEAQTAESSEVSRSGEAGRARRAVGAGAGVGTVTGDEPGCGGGQACRRMG